MDKSPTIIVTLPEFESEPKTFELHGNRIGLGRETDNQITVAATQVSSSHCEFLKTEDGYEIVDLDSTNGTRVNGKRIKSQLLKDGDRILLGETVAAHFIMLAAGETVRAVATAGDQAQNAAAATYTRFDQKLQSIEADIAAKEGEHKEIAAKLATMREEFEAKKREHDQLLASMRQLSDQIAAKKAESGSSEKTAEELAALESELMFQTRRVQVLATDLDGQREQMRAMQSEAAPTPAKQGPIKIAEMLPPGTAPDAAPAAPAFAPPPAAYAPPPAAAAPAAAFAPPPAVAPPAAYAAPQPVAPAPVPAAQPPVPIPIDPAAGAPPTGNKTVLVAGGKPGAASMKLIVEQPTKPRPKLNLG